jgi:murein DD-endopeptidase MepM/ murein hydrolase activator NlpD
MVQVNQKKSGGRRRAWWSVLLVACGALSVSGAEQAYLVRRSDTLSSIARRYEVTVPQLVERNNLSGRNYVYIGQRLIIPTKTTTPAPAVARAGLNTTIQRVIDNAPVAPGRWQYVVIHHSGVDEGTMQAMDRYHREVRHMENGLAYHFVIGNGNGMGDGEIAVGRRWREQLDGGHLHSEAQNKIALGICLVGNFDEDKPTAKQMQSLDALVKALLKRCSLYVSAVKTHQQINVIGTRCPGQNFPTKTFLRGLK